MVTPFLVKCCLIPRLLSLFPSPQPGANTPYLPASVSVIGSQDIPLLSADNLLSPVEKLQQSIGSGFVSLSLERDSIVRNVPLIARFDNEGTSQIVPSIALEMLRVAQGARGHILKVSQDTGTTHNQIRSGRVVVNADEFGRLPLHHGYADRFTIVSASDVLEDNNLSREAEWRLCVGRGLCCWLERYTLNQPRSSHSWRFNSLTSPFANALGSHIKIITIIDGDGNCHWVFYCQS